MSGHHGTLMVSDSKIRIWRYVWLSEDEAVGFMDTRRGIWYQCVV